jgi:YVTN family beta-propeller protein
MLAFSLPWVDATQQRPRVWVANGQDGTVSSIDPETNQVGTVHLGSRPAAVAVEQGAVWVALAA